MADSGAAPGAKKQHGGGPAEGRIPKLNTPSAEGIGASTSEGQGTVQTPSEPQSGLSDIPHLEGTGDSEGLGMARTPIGTSSKASSRPGVGHRPPFPGRRAPSTRSATSAGTQGSRARRPTAISDIYYETPEIPTWVGEDDTQEYASWTAETEDHLSRLLADVTEPPRDGMFQRVDPDGLLRAVAQSFDDAIFQSRWERLLHCYDAAMGGKGAALRAIAGALRKAEESQNQAVQLRGTMRSFFDEKKVLDRAIAQLEGEKMKQEKQIITLERATGVLTRDQSTLQAKFTQVCNARDKDLETLKGVLSSWETLTGAALGSASGGETDYAARFDSVLETLKEARAATLRTEARNKRLEEQIEALEEKVYSAENRPKSQQGPSKSELALKSKVTNLERRNQDLERELVEAWAQAAKPQESPTKSVVSRGSSTDSQVVELANEKVDQLEKELARYKDRCGVLERTVDDLRQKVDVVQEIRTELDSISEGIAKTSAIHLEKSQQLSDEVEMLSRNAQSPTSDPNAADELQRVASGELDELRNKLKSYQDTFQKLSQVIQDLLDRLAARRKLEARSDPSATDELQESTSGKLEELQNELKWYHDTFQKLSRVIQEQLDRLAAKNGASSSKHRQKLKARSPDHLPDSLGSQADSPYRGGPFEIKYLDGARKLIEQLLPDLRREDGPEAAVRECRDQLSALHSKLSAAGPYTITDTIAADLDDFLYQSQETGIRNAMVDFITDLEYFDQTLNAALRVERFSPMETSDERKMLNEIRARIHDIETLQKLQVEAIRESEDTRVVFAQHPPDLSRAIFEVCKSAFETSDGAWKEAAVVEPLVDRVHKLVAESSPDKVAQLVRTRLETQEQQLAELGHDLTTLGKLADETKDQLRGVQKLRGKRPAPAHPEDEELDNALEGALRRREMRLHRLRVSVRECFDRLELDTMSTQSFLDRGSDAERRQAQMFVTEALARQKMREHEMSGVHDESLCFCHLLQTLFPEAYRWCCTTEIQGHGHRILSPYPKHRLPDTPFWEAVCNVFTAFFWILLIILVQPRNFLTTLSFLLGLLADFPVFIFTFLTRRPQPVIRAPPTEKLVGAVITTSFFYYVLAYIAVIAERRLWVGASDWRFAYVLDMISGKPLPYEGWSPVRVDARLVFDPLFTWVSGKVHGAFGGIEAVVVVVSTLLLLNVMTERGFGWLTGGTWGRVPDVPPSQEAGHEGTPPAGRAPGSQPPAEHEETPPVERAPGSQPPVEHEETPPVERVPGSQPPAEHEETPPVEHTPKPQAPTEHQETSTVESEVEAVRSGRNPKPGSLDPQEASSE